MAGNKHRRESSRGAKFFITSNRMIQPRSGGHHLVLQLLNSSKFCLLPPRLPLRLALDGDRFADRQVASARFRDEKYEHRGHQKHHEINQR
jgi:hypothetical protein